MAMMAIIKGYKMQVIPSDTLSGRQVCNANMRSMRSSGLVKNGYKIGIDMPWQPVVCFRLRNFRNFSGRASDSQPKEPKEVSQGSKNEPKHDAKVNVHEVTCK